MLWSLCFLVGFVSLLVGSFLNVVIHRLPLMMYEELRQQCDSLFHHRITKSQTLNLAYPRSHCPKCHTMVSAWQNIPLLSFLLLRGRCHHCKERISLRYPLVELLAVLGSIGACMYFDELIVLFFALIALYFLICLVFIDIEHHILPDVLTLGFLWVGLLANTQNLFSSLTSAVFGAIAGYLSLWFFIKLYFLCTGKVGMGHGDFKLFAALGAWFGLAYLPFIIFIASVLGAVYGLIYLMVTRQSKNTRIPFGPFLCMAGVLMLFFRHELWRVAIL